MGPFPFSLIIIDKNKQKLLIQAWLIPALTAWQIDVLSCDVWHQSGMVKHWDYVFVIVELEFFMSDLVCYASESYVSSVKLSSEIEL